MVASGIFSQAAAGSVTLGYGITPGIRYYVSMQKSYASYVPSFAPLRPKIPSAFYGGRSQMGEAMTYFAI